MKFSLRRASDHMALEGYPGYAPKAPYVVANTVAAGQATMVADADAKAVAKPEAGKAPAKKPRLEPWYWEILLGLAWFSGWGAVYHD